MQVEKNKVVSIHYKLMDNDGNTLDSSEGRDPLNYIHGNGNLIPGMEEGLEGKQPGDKLDIKVAPDKGYGTRNDSLVQDVPKAAFGDQEVKPGMQFNTQDGHTVTVTKVGLENVTVDGNHPLAGMDLNFDVKVVSVREATPDELDHGHVHGPGGHHH
ncbi:MAG: peptidylprolyl isomerase [Cyclobacteriaceae bacterium]|nr:peptidylprolyl isomerase [Cyclobacteriaceae bacterium]